MASAASSQQRVSVPSGTDFRPLSPALRSAINEALIANNAVADIQAALLHECQLAGFTTAIRARVVDLLRSGDCTTYAEVLREVLGEIRSATAESDTAGGTARLNGEEGDAADEDRKLKVPKRVMEEGVKKVKAALETCVDVIGTE